MLTSNGYICNLVNLIIFPYVLEQVFERVNQFKRFVRNICTGRSIKKNHLKFVFATDII